MIFAPGQGPLLFFLSDLRGHFSRLGNGAETGQFGWWPTKYLWAKSCCWSERLYQCLEETFSLRLMTIALCSDWLCKKWPSESCFSFEVCFCPTGVNNLVALPGLKPCIFKGGGRKQWISLFAFKLVSKSSTRPKIIFPIHQDPEGVN